MLLTSLLVIIRKGGGGGEKEGNKGSEMGREGASVRACMCECVFARECVYCACVFAWESEG